MTTKVESKISILNDTLISIFGESLNLARIKFIGLFITALCSAQTVCFEKLAICFDHKAKVNSSLRRIQRFIAEFNLDLDLIAILIYSLLPHDPPYSLAMDRTNWKFGQTNINFLVIAIVYDGVAFPILFKLLPKFGNSSTKERINLMNHYINLFGKDSIKFFLADREFIGEKWMKYLNKNKIKYHVRIRNNFIAFNKKNQRKFNVSRLFSHLKCNQSDYYRHAFYIGNQKCFISGSLAKSKEGKPELQIIVSFESQDLAQNTYKQRWQIETAFRALKSSGFNIEDTHLKDPERIEKLLSLVLIAYTWAYKTGIFLNKIAPITIKKHKRRAKSLFKYGLDYLANQIFSNNLENYKICCNFLSCT